MMDVLKSKKGMSLIEVMIVLTVISLIGLGTTSLMRNMLQIQKRSETSNNLQTFAANLQSVLQNDEAWAQTVANSIIANNQVGCINDSALSLCNHDPAPPGSVSQIDVLNPPAPIDTRRFQIFNEAGSSVYNPRLPTSGFTPTGQLCNAYNGAAGNDACPFRYDITWYADCSDGIGPCNKPRVTIVATFVNNPRSKGDPLFRLNTQDLSFAIRRGEKNRHQPFRIIYWVQGNETNRTGTIPAEGFGGGRCANGTDTRRPLNEVNDPDGSVLSLASNIFRLSAGRYECNISAQAYQATNGVKIILHNMTNSVRIDVGAAFSSEGSTATVNGSVNFEISAAANFELLHLSNSCDIGTPGFAPPQSEDDFAMGIPSPDAFAGSPPIPSSYGGSRNIYTDISCVRSS